MSLRARRRPLMALPFSPLALGPLAVAVALAVGLSAAPRAQVTALDAFSGVRFQAPVELAVAPGQPERAYVVEQGAGSGRARVVTLVPGDAAATVFVDLDDRVRAGGERGLLGLAFHPDYEANGRVFVHYTARPDGRSVVSELARASGDALTADPASERVLLEVAQPFSNHNGGKIAFGPDGHLHIALGDGGAGDDPVDAGQRLDTPLGALLRIDVDSVPEGEAYGIPADNPFANTDGPERREIYAYGLRNPWKFSFDSATGDLWLGDVGQGLWEEINVIRSGGNYGWRPVEGPVCNPSFGACDLSAFDAPVFSYPHNGSLQGGFSISGGFVYRGSDVAGLAGRYLYADFVQPRLWALDYDAASGEASSQLLSSSIPNIAAINEGPGGEAFVISYGGTIYRLEGAVVASEGSAPEAGAPEAGLRIALAGPNPSGGATALRVSGAGAAPLRVTAFDALGRRLGVLHDGPAPRSGRIALDPAALGVGAGVVLVVAETPGARASVRITVGR